MKQTPPRTEMVSGAQGRERQDTDGVGSTWRNAQERSLGQLNGRLAGRSAGRCWRRSRHQYRGQPHNVRPVHRDVRIVDSQCGCLGRRSVQGATTSVGVAQSKAATAATLRGCPMGSGVEGSALKGNKAQGSIGLGGTGNRVGQQRILCRSKAVRSRTARWKQRTGRRRDGNGRGDAARLVGRERLRRV